MRFEYIDIKNYRQYRSLRIDFPKSEGHDLQVLIGDNGTGKTNLLNAFTWCLYGDERHLGDSTKGKGEPKLNKDEALEMVATGRPIAYVSVVVAFESDGRRYEVTRKVPFRVTSVTSKGIVEKVADERFSVCVMEASSPAFTYEGEAADRKVNACLPESIREYFFFDGEQLTSYFSENRGPQIRKAIHSISQIDLITLIKGRMEKVVGELRREAAKESPKLDLLNANLERYQAIVAKETEKIEKNKEDIANARSKVEELTEKLRGVEGLPDLEKKRATLLVSLKSEKENLLTVRESYKNFAREKMVDFAFYETAKKSLKAIRVLEENRSLPPSIDKGFLSRMLKEGCCNVCNRPLSDTDRRNIEELLESFAVSSETSNILTGMRSELQRIISSVESYKKEALSKGASLAKAQNDLDRIEKNLRDIDVEISGYSNANMEQIKNWVDTRKRLEAQIERLIGENGAADTRRVAAKNQEEKTRKEIQKESAKMVKSILAQNQVDFGEEAIRILNEVESGTISEVREGIAERSKELFKSLVWKDSKCADVKLSEDYQLSLYDAMGISCAGTCSAAERSLLALSFTLAMHEVSGFESPLFIDTPIARASGENRANFAKTLVDVSKRKQLILTFTPDEYSEAISREFDGVAASYRRLALDENERVVTLRGAEDGF